MSKQQINTRNNVNTNTLAAEELQPFTPSDTKSLRKNLEGLKEPSSLCKNLTSVSFFYGFQMPARAFCTDICILACKHARPFLPTCLPLTPAELVFPSTVDLWSFSAQHHQTLSEWFLAEAQGGGAEQAVKKPTWVDQTEERVVRRQAAVPLKPPIGATTRPLDGQNVWLHWALSARTIWSFDSPPHFRLTWESPARNNIIFPFPFPECNT